MVSKDKKIVRKVKASRANHTEIVANPSPIEEGHPTPPDVPVRRHRRPSLGLKLERSEIYEVDFESFMNDYSILDNVRMTVPDPDDRVVSPPSRYVAFYKDAFEGSV